MKNNVVLKVLEEDCCSCSACANRCPVNAITMQENKEGFLHPVINEDACVDCGQCLKVCPSLNEKKENFLDPKCYAVAAQDEIRANSSSGGLFTILAEYIIKQGGIVCGAAFDEKWNVHHILVDKLEDLNKLKGSKYVQSAIENTYSEIQKLLNNGKKVLFSGTPCQVAGLYTFLGKEYTNLLTMDILCHGAPSRSVWQKYLHEAFDFTKIKNVNFRDKSQIGWSCSHSTITLDNDQKVVSDEYTKLFHQSMILNKACQNCKYSKLPRPADITGGDWWGISKYKEGLNDGKGLSFVLVNTSKGEDIFKTIQKDMKQSLPIELGKDYNNGRLRHNDPHHVARDKFFFNYAKNLSLPKIYDICANSKYDVCIVSIFYAINYGSALVSHAVYKIIEDLGYSCLMLQKPDYVWKGHPTDKHISGRFAAKYCNLSKIYKNRIELMELNNICSNFVVGSDQMFSPFLKVEHAYLEFVSLNKNKIAFGTSFGKDDYNKPEQAIQKDRELLHRFNHIALREKSDKLCHNIFKLRDSIEVIDPTLMITKQHWISVCKDINLDEAQTPYLLVYILDLTKQKADAVKYISNKLHLKIIYIPELNKLYRKDYGLQPTKDEYTPEEFLYLYKNASFVVTDSYHGTCFATKFNKPFISIINRVRGGLRYKLFDAIKVSSRLVDNPEDVYNNDTLFQPFDFTETNEIIKEKADFAINWLKSALENNNSSEKFSENDFYTDEKIKELSMQIEELSVRANNIQKIAEQNKHSEPTADVKKVPIYVQSRNINDFTEEQLKLIYIMEHLNSYRFKKWLYKFKKKIYKGKKREKYEKKYADIKILIKNAKKLQRQSQILDELN